MSLKRFWLLLRNSASTVLFWGLQILFFIKEERTDINGFLQGCSSAGRAVHDKNQ